MNFKYIFLYAILLGFISFAYCSASDLDELSEVPAITNLQTFISKKQRDDFIKELINNLQESMQLIKQAYEQWNISYNNQIQTKLGHGIDAYAILSLPDDVDSAQIQNSYKKLSKKTDSNAYKHPTSDTDAEVIRILSCDNVLAQIPLSENQYAQASDLLLHAYDLIKENSNRAQYDTHIKEIREMKGAHAKIQEGVNIASMIITFLQSTFQHLVQDEVIQEQDIDAIKEHAQDLLDVIKDDPEGTLLVQDGVILSDYLQNLLDTCIEKAKKNLEGIAVDEEIIEFKKWLEVPGRDITKSYEIYNNRTALQYAIYKNNAQMAELILAFAYEHHISIHQLTDAIAKQMKQNIESGNTSLNNGIWATINIFDTNIFHTSDTKVGPLAQVLFNNFM